MRDMSHVLELWAGWARSENSGIDYSPVAAGFKGLLQQSSGINLMCSDNDGLIIESCLSRLKLKKPEEYKLIVLHYFYRVSKRKLASNAKKDEKIIRINIKMAEGFIEGCLCMLDVSLDMD